MSQTLLKERQCRWKFVTNCDMNWAFGVVNGISHSPATTVIPHKRLFRVSWVVPRVKRPYRGRFFLLTGGKT